MWGSPRGPREQTLRLKFSILGVFWPFRPKRALPHSITIQNMRFGRLKNVCGRIPLKGESRAGAVFFNYACCLLLGVSLSEVFKRGTARWARAVGSGQCSWKHLQAIFSSTWQLAKYVNKQQRGESKSANITSRNS